jgi:hypothetical protein
MNKAIELLLSQRLTSLINKSKQIKINFIGRYLDMMHKIFYITILNEHTAIERYAVPSKDSTHPLILPIESGQALHRGE